MAVFSLDFWEVALCPRISPESAAKALTRVTVHQPRLD
jgi:hypothetical protein